MDDERVTYDLPKNGCCVGLGDLFLLITKVKIKVKLKKLAHIFIDIVQYVDKSHACMLSFRVVQSRSKPFKTVQSRSKPFKAVPSYSKSFKVVESC